MSATLTPNWIEETKNKITCGYQVTTEALRSFLFATEVEALLATCPDILNGESESANNINVNAYYTRVKNAQLLSEIEAMQANALLNILKAQCNAADKTADVTSITPIEIFATGTWLRASGHDYISVPGILATDIVIFTLNVRAADEIVMSAAANAVSNRIDITFSGTPVDGTTAGSYLVIRKLN